MSKFVTGKQLESVISDIIWDAKEILIIVSPFIKLDIYFKKLFDNHVNNPSLHILIIFGKNENKIQKSLTNEDFEYFKKFLNISIIYISNLHAKYFGNEKKGVITSINLYDYSFLNNIEFGVFTEQSMLSKFSDSHEDEAWAYSLKIANEGDAIFIKRPVYEIHKGIISSSSHYVKSDIKLDLTENFYSVRKMLKIGEKPNSNQKYKLSDFDEFYEIGKSISKRPEREEIVPKQEFGYCIRSGIKIPFNINQPMSKSAWLIWNEYNNYDYPETYCHKTGVRSYGKTSMRKPIL
jgi:hypothetical protein